MNGSGGGGFTFTNCIIANVTNLAAPSGASLSADHNGFYNSGGGSNFGTTVVPIPSYPFQTVGGGNYYLTNGTTCRGAGTTNIDPLLLTQLKNKTTWPPIIYDGVQFTNNVVLGPQAPRETNTTLDLGYHYDPMDYVFGGCDLYTNLTFTAGTAVGWIEDFGSVNPSGQPYSFTLNDGANLYLNGTATQPCEFAWRVMVQESQNGNWNTYGWMAPIIINGSGAIPVPQVSATFTKWLASTMVPEIRDNWDYGVGRFANCEFYNGTFASYAPSFYFTNCLLFRDFSVYWDGHDAASFTYQNCTFYNGVLAFSRVAGQSTSFWTVKNTTFDGTAFSWTDNYGGNTNYTAIDYNAYNSSNLSWQTYPFPYPPNYGTLEVVGVHDQMVSGLNWQSSWFGNFYLPPGSPVIDMGSTTADQVGLYSFTTQTNQAAETNSIVDIGYHYVALGINGLPLDINGDGIPDYLENFQAPVITSQPTNMTLIQGSNAAFSVTAIGTLPLTYQWRLNTTNLLAATNASVTITNVQTANAGNYNVVVTNVAGSVTSLNAGLTVLVPLTIVTQPQPPVVTTAQGTAVAFAAVVAGTSPSYQWFFNGTTLLMGATNATLTMTNVQFAGSGNYSLTASNLLGTVTSSNATLTVTLPPLNWLERYFGLNYMNNTNALATADPDGDGVNNFQEYLNGTDPTDYYNSVLPNLTIISGNNQNGPLNNYLPLPMKLEVLKSGLPLTNAPITFSVTNGINLLAISTNGGNQSSTLALLTDTNGFATVWLFLPTNSPASINVIATAQSGTNSVQTAFAETSTNTVATPVITLGGGTFAINQNVGISCTTTGAVMHYTLNGNSPTELDPVVTNNQVLFIQGTSTLKVQAFEDGVLFPSAILTAVFNINGAIDAGYYHTLALKYNGSVWAAGTNGNGRLGDGTTNSRAFLVPVTNLTGVTIAVAAGAGHSLAMESDGSVRAWGLNNFGQLGNNSISNQYLTNVMVLNITNTMAVAAGASNSLALLSNGTVRAWGYNTDGELGDSTTTYRRTNVLVLNLSNVVAIAAGGSHGLALLTNGTVRAWGLNSNGQLGDNTTVQRNTNVIVSNLVSVASISAGNLFSLAVLSNSTVRAWGYNAGGQLGDGTTQERHTNVVVVGLSNVVAVAAGGFHSLALLNDGTVRAWGTNNFGQLGDGSTNKYRLTNVFVVGISNIVAIAAGSAHSVALRSDGLIFIWGYTNYGLPGGYSSTPVAIQPTNHQTYWVTPSIVTQPQSQSVILGGNVGFVVTTVGTFPMSYQWYSNSITIIGATNSSLAINNVQTNRAAGYSVVASNTAGSVTSATAYLTVIVPQSHQYSNSAITVQPQNQTVIAGSPVTLNVGSTGTMPIYYQWYCYTSGIIPGATNASLTFSNAQTSNSDLYYVTVGNSGSAATSLTAVLTVIDPTVDSDGNGLPDWWELKYFGHTGVNPLVDPDGDGYSNLQEYLNGTNPLQPDQPFGIIIIEPSSYSTVP
jgi:alpha-tubulin suppressor-like RCC1 family protein